LELSIRETFNRVVRLNKRVIFVYSNPEFRLDPLRCLDLRPIRFFSVPNNASCETLKADYDKSQKTYRLLVTKILKDYPEILLFDTAPIFCNELNCTGIKDGKLLYIGDNHISLSGSLLIAKEISPMLKQ
jgi:hypothetical protein